MFNEGNNRLPKNKIYLLTEDPDQSFIDLLTYFDPYQKKGDYKSLTQQQKQEWFGKGAGSVGENVLCGEGVRFGRGVCLMGNNVIGHGCVIEDEVVLHPGVVLYDGCFLGKRVCVHANTVIGSDGFGYRFLGGRHVKVPQIGRVVIEEDVEIGANCCIDRATIDTTVIGKGCKLDNLIQIAHNVRIGVHGVMAGQSGIAGSTKVGNYVMIGGRTCVVDHCTIGDHVIIGGDTTVTASQTVDKGTILLGRPAIPYREELRIQALLKQLLKDNKDKVRKQSQSS